MLAYVKYEYKARAILPVNLIKLFEPESIDDFDPRKQVNAFWCSEDRSIFGYYPAFVHALADDLELMHSKLKSFRDPFLRVIDVDLQCSKEPVGKRRKMPSSKGKKKYRAEAVDLVNEAIIEQCGTELENEEVRQKTAELQDALHRKEKELKRLRKELREANELNQRLTSALLDKIEVARATTQPEGTVIAEVVMASCLDADSGLPKEMLCDAPSSAGDSHGNETADQPLEEGHKEMIEKPVALFEAVDGQAQVLIGPQLWMPAAKWIYVMKNTSYAKCCLEVARHLWTLSEAAERSLTGQQCRSIATAARKLPATPEKVEVMKNRLAYFVDQHPVPELPKDHRVAAVRKHLRSFFTEAARQGKRVRGAARPRDTQTNELQQHPNQ
ncbi:uncharacterized protein LOC144132655 isoform X2 [Amblyomma americanum]